jgi:putative ABC transport system permease protein
MTLSGILLASFRSLRSRRLQTGLNVAGLSVGLAISAIIALYIWSECSYDRFHSKTDRIWRVTRTFLNNEGGVDLQLSSIAPPFGSLLPEHFPEIEKITRLLPNNILVRTNSGEQFREDNVFFADEQMPQIFDLPMQQGTAADVLAQPWHVLLSESAAHRFFGDRDPRGESLLADNQFRLTVGGVFRDFPQASHWHPDVLVSFNTLRDSTLYGERRLRTNFSNNAFYTYVLVNQNFNKQNMEARFPDFLDAVMSSKKANATKPHEYTRLHLQKLSDIHLKSHYDDEIEAGGDWSRVQILGIIALFILLIAAINYVNLSTAFSLSRAREIGVRKSVGAGQGQLAVQFLVESLLLTFVAGVVAYGLVMAVIPMLKNVLDLEVASVLLLGWEVPLVLLVMTLATGLLAGIYPAFFMSSFKIIRALKGGATAGQGVRSMRKSLVVAQFALTIVLMIGTGVVYQQLHYMQTKSLGYDRSQVINLSSNNTLNTNWEAFRRELLANPVLLNAGRSSRLPSGRLLDDLGGKAVQMGDTMTKLNATLKILTVDMDFADTYNMSLSAGRDFSRDFMGDTTHGWLLNEAAVRAIGWRSADEAIDKRLIYGDREDCYVRGVLKDFHFESLHQEILPMIFMLPEGGRFLNEISIKLGPNTAAALAHTEQVWKKFNPDTPFEYIFLDENFGRLYQSEQRQGQLYLVFAFLAIFIACLGLFGLATFEAHQRTKEIGVRKVLGASVAGITGLLTKDFLKLVLIALVIASPVAWYFMENWLTDFAYRIQMPWGTFLAAGSLAVVIAFLTVSTQSVKAALVNPVKSLKSE